MEIQFQIWVATLRPLNDSLGLRLTINRVAHAQLLITIKYSFSFRTVQVDILCGGMKLTFFILWISINK